MSMKTKDFEVTDYLHTEADMMAYLNAIAEEGDTGLLLAALGDVAKARDLPNPGSAAPR